MTKPIKKNKIEEIHELLPPCWLRRNATSPDSGAVHGNIQRVGPNGELHQRFIETIDAANEVVLLSSFLLSDEDISEAMLQAHDRGVRVYALTASKNRVASLVKEDDEFDARMVAEHKELLNRLVGKVLLRSAEHFHAKFIITDPQSNPHGWISTANFNLALKKSVELAVRLSPKSARSLADWFAKIFWTESEQELVEKNRLSEVTPPPKIPPAPSKSDIVVTTQRDTSIRSVVLNLIENARQEILISTYGLSSDHPVVQALIKKAEEGIPVTVLTRPRPAIMGTVTALKEAEIRVLAHDKLHAKAIYTDAGAMVMTANLESSGLDYGFEVGVLLSDQDSLNLKDILDSWIAEFPWQYEPAMQRKEHVGQILLANSSLRDGIREVVKEETVLLNDVFAEDALDLNQAPNPTFTEPNLKTFPHKIKYEWQVLPRRLPAKTKELKKQIEVEDNDKQGKKKKATKHISYDPKVYQDNKKRVFVLLDDETKLGKAKQLAKELNGKVVLP